MTTKSFITVGETPRCILLVLIIILRFDWCFGRICSCVNVICEPQRLRLSLCIIVQSVEKTYLAYVRRSHAWLEMDGGMKFCIQLLSLNRYMSIERLKTEQGDKQHQTMSIRHPRWSIWLREKNSQGETFIHSISNNTCCSAYIGHRIKVNWFSFRFRSVMTNVNEESYGYAHYVDGSLSILDTVLLHRRYVILRYRIITVAPGSHGRTVQVFLKKKFVTHCCRWSPHWFVQCALLQQRRALP